MSPPSTCPPDSDILAFVEGELSDDDQLAVAAHVGTCSECRQRAVEYRALEKGVRAVSSKAAIRWHAFESAFGPVCVAATDRGLARLSATHHDPDDFRRELEDGSGDRPVIHDEAALQHVRRELEEYFAGGRSQFDVPVDLSVRSDFERSVLGTLREEVPFGEVVPYGELARRIGRPKAARAVGNALGKNPVPIVVPCHRVIRSDGSLGGYTSGLEYKRRLLTIEGRDDLLRTG